ncbi:MAG: hypothetical protein J0H11_21765 [Rhizobiales bacterium]|nr:hypothetical protein [Hyphomicrobiales bacterium]
MAVGEGDHVLGPNLQDRVPFIILELADGDVRRRQRQISQANRAAWAMRALHHAAVGLNQLHQADISHQDLKPSNLMSFSDRSLFKVGDMGRSLMLGATIQHENYYVAGDPTYAPLELLYGYVSPDWDTRRLGCDLYLLGSMAVFFFLGHGLTPLVLSRLDGQHVPADLGGGWEGSYEDVLPIIRSAFTSVLGELHEALPERLREPVVAAVRALCEPDPLLRGHPRTRAQINSNRFELTRFISEFNYLATQAQIDARGTLA